MEMTFTVIFWWVLGVIFISSATFIYIKALNSHRGSLFLGILSIVLLWVGIGILQIPNESNYTREKRILKKFILSHPTLSERLKSPEISSLVPTDSVTTDNCKLFTAKLIDSDSLYLFTVVYSPNCRDIIGFYKEVSHPICDFN